jgi:hypothetical protein
MPLIIPPSLAAYPQFILYTVAPSATRPGKTDKFPVHPVTGVTYNAHDPVVWLSASDATRVYDPQRHAGIGFVFTTNDPFFFLDIDDALQPDNTWSLAAQQICQFMQGCFIEVSLSGAGLHIIGSGVPTDHRCKYKTPELDIDLYTEGRFVALTGYHAAGDPGHVAQPQLDWLIQNYFPPTGVTAAPEAWTDGPEPEWTGTTDDDELIKRMLLSKSANVFNNRATVQDLWNCNIDALALAYPPQSGTNPFDHSSADAALCQHLAFWTGRDCERISRLFRRSGLYREKWEREGYARTTVLHGVSHCRQIYTHKPDEPTVERVEPTPTEPGCAGLRDGVQMLSVPAQVDYFKGCVYIQDIHQVFTPNGFILRPDQFKTAYGGYTFSIDMVNDKVTRSAWEALTENMGYNFPKVHTACFRPENETGAIMDEEGWKTVNTYYPIETEQKPGDPGRVLRHLALMLPHPQDQAIMLAYMASLVQNPGAKFQWCPLIQGMEGNGKSLIIRALTHAVGARYTHTPNAKDIDNKFNAWICNKLFIGVEEIYTADRQDKIDALKPLITNDRVDIQGKGKDQVTGDNRANFVMCSNHKDAIRKTLSDRRYCVFYTAQQEPGDIQKAGMQGNYFPDLYDWLRAEGYAIFNWYLRQYKIPDELNPATLCQVAPTTSSTAEAIRASMGGIEQDVMEAIEEGRPGFAGGWISSFAFDKLLDDRRAGNRIPRNKRKEILKGLGYEWHPALNEGRLNNPISDGGTTGRPRLFCRRDNPVWSVGNAADVARMYQEAQMGVTAAVFGGN